METINGYIDEIKKRYSVDSDYRLAQLLGVTRQAIHHQKIGRTKHVSDETAYQIAALLGLDPKKVLIINAAERAKNDKIRRLWQSVVKEISKSAAALVLGALLLIPSLPSVPVLYIMSNRRRGVDNLDCLWA